LEEDNEADQNPDNLDSRGGKPSGDGFECFRHEDLSDSIPNTKIQTSKFGF
jgi:hypothetical protein